MESSPKKKEPVQVCHREDMLKASAVSRRAEKFTLRPARRSLATSRSSKGQAQGAGADGPRTRTTQTALLAVAAVSYCSLPPFNLCSCVSFALSLLFVFHTLR